MSAAVDAVAAFLSAQGLAGGSTGWALQTLQVRDTPDQVVVVIPTGGPEPEQASDRAWWRPSFQVFVRGGKPNTPAAGPAAAEAKATTIMEALNRGAVNGFKNFRATQSGAIPLGADADGRHQIVVNFRGDQT